MSMKTKPVACPEDDVFLRVFLESAEESGRETFIDHVFHCGRCRIKFDALQSLGGELKNAEAEFPEAALAPREAKMFRKMANARIREIKSARRRPGGAAFLRRPKTLAWAVPALLTIVLAGYFLCLRLTDNSTMRNSKGSNIQLIAPRGRLTEAPSVFSWKPYDNADRYFYKLVDEDLNTVVSGDTIGRTFIIDNMLRQKLVKGKTYLWSVEARADNEAPIASTKETFVIR
jgi:hypothetical protein